MTSGLLAPLSTALFKMVVGVVVVQREGVGEVVGAREVLVARATTRLTASPTILWSPSVMLTAELAVTIVFPTTTAGVAGASVAIAVVLTASISSKMDEGRNPAARISGSHFTRIGAITKIWKIGCMGPRNN